MRSDDNRSATRDEADQLPRWHRAEARRDKAGGVDPAGDACARGNQVPEAWGGRQGQEPAKDDSKEAPPEGEQKRPWPRAKKIIVALVVGAVLLLAALGGLVWWLHARQFEKTDDAFIDVHSEQVAPQVAGRVLRVLVTDNQQVRAGEVLLEIDPADFQVQIEQAQAAVSQARGGLSQAEAQVRVDNATVEQTRADLVQATVTEENAKTERARYEALPEGAVSPQQRDNIRAAAKNATAQRVAIEKRVAAAEAQVQLAASQLESARANLKAAEAKLRQAQLNLGYTTVPASVAGRVTNRNVQVGDYVTAGQQLMVLVPHEVWVTANYKETQLTHMRPGQQATIEVDAFPSATFRGHVDSIQKGSGAWFSLLPPENATGNYVKVVQRVPVKIVFDDKSQDAYGRLAPGMSVVPKVRVR